jgi:hypothetical protein
MRDAFFVQLSELMQIVRIHIHAAMAWPLRYEEAQFQDTGIIGISDS